jgi:FtsP/CotA-like multicopper oxidase with cupredoxin domain
VYQFEADHAGAFMYHCGTAPALHHIGNGMYGAIIIDPPVLAPVDQEFVMVQSELYLGPAGRTGRPHQDASTRTSTPWCSTATGTSTSLRPDPRRDRTSGPGVGHRRRPE